MLGLLHRTTPQTRCTQKSLISTRWQDQYPEATKRSDKITLFLCVLRRDLLNNAPVSRKSAGVFSRTARQCAMVRAKTYATRPSRTADKPNLRQRRLGNATSAAERSAYFARREAAKVLRSVLHGDANRRAVGSIKSLVYSPSVRNKKATFALVCQTLKHLEILKNVLETSSILTGKWKRHMELMYIITYDILFGQASSLVGDAEGFIMDRKVSLQSALARLIVGKKVKSIEDLLALYQTNDCLKPRYVRVNTLKMNVESVLHELGKQHMVQKDEMVPDLFILPPGSDLHNHPLVTSGSVFMQGRASSMVAVALGPEPEWEVLDACAAPGNKTVHLAALMRGNGKVIACELNKERVKRLEDTIKLSGASNVKVLHGDFLSLNPRDPSYAKIRAILLDPSCSGSGTAAERLDHLLPSYIGGHPADDADTERLNKLSSFQKKALAHALSFPAVERVVYSTCSIHQIENEDVVKHVLPLATSFGFQLEAPFPLWPRRGLPVVEGSEHLIRLDPAKDKEGFFIALFVRKKSIVSFSENPATTCSQGTIEDPCKEKTIRRSRIVNHRKLVTPSHFGRMSKMLFCPQLNICKRS